LNENYNRDALGLAWRRVRREVGWSLVIILILTSGLVAWILIPSVATSLELGVSNYSNGVGTYFVVNPSGTRCSPIFEACSYTLPNNVTDAVASIPGVERTYPIILNLTRDTSPCWSIDVVTGKNVSYAHCFTGYTSALLGGPKGFPPDLLALTQGRLPDNAPEIAVNQGMITNAARPWRLDQTKPLEMGCELCPETNTFHGNITDPFNATVVGVAALNPLFVNVFLFWNSTFMLHKLGPVLYHQTWGVNGSNYVIVKVDSVADIPPLVNATERIIQAPEYGLFGVMYNQALSQSLQSLTTQTAPLYQLIGILSLIAVVGVSFLVAHLIAGRRDWEAGVYLTQGWKWSEVYTLYSVYFLILSLASFIIAAVVSYFAIKYFVATYNVFGTIVTFTASVVPLYLISGLAFAFALAFFAAYTVVRRQRRMGLDNIVREY
jgi:hypothetical protein